MVLIWSGPLRSRLHNSRLLSQPSRQRLVARVYLRPFRATFGTYQVSIKVCAPQSEAALGCLTCMHILVTETLRQSVEFISLYSHAAVSSTLANPHDADAIAAVSRWIRTIFINLMSSQIVNRAQQVGMFPDLLVRSCCHNATDYYSSLLPLCTLQLMPLPFYSRCARRQHVPKLVLTNKPERTR